MTNKKNAALLLEHYRIQNAEPTQKGICAGFLEASRMYFLMDRVKIDFLYFKKLIGYILSKDPDTLKIEVDSVIYKKKHGFSEEKIQLTRDVYDLFKIIAIFSRPNRHVGLLNNVIGQANVTRIISAFEKNSSPFLKNKIGITEKIGSFPIMFNPENHIGKDYLYFLFQMAKKTKSISARICFVLDTLHHRFGLFYDGKNDEWYMSNIQQLDGIGEPILPASFSEMIFKAARTSSKDTIVGFDTAIYVLSHDAVPLKKTMHDLKDSCWTLFSVEKEFFEGMSHKSYAYAYLAAKFGYTDIIKTLQLICPATVESPKIISAMLDVAIDLGQRDVVKMLVEKNQEDNLKGNEKILSPLFWAAHFGDIVIIRELEKAGATLTHREFELLLDSIAREGLILALQLCLPYLKKNNELNKPIRTKLSLHKKMTLLQIAMLSDQEKMVMVLLDERAAIPMDYWEEIQERFHHTKKLSPMMLATFKRDDFAIPNHVIHYFLNKAIDFIDLEGFYVLAHQLKPTSFERDTLLKRINRRYQASLMSLIKNTNVLHCLCHMTDYVRLLSEKWDIEIHFVSPSV